jgi:hypothetical protein
LRESHSAEKNRLREEVSQSKSALVEATAHVETLQGTVTERNQQLSVLMETLETVQAAQVEGEESEACEQRCLALSSQLAAAVAVESGFER